MAWKLIGIDVEPSELYRTYYNYAAVLMENDYINKIINKTRLTGTNYIEKIPNNKLKENVISFITNSESVLSNVKGQERIKLLKLNKEILQSHF